MAGRGGRVSEIGGAQSETLISSAIFTQLQHTLPAAMRPCLGLGPQLASGLGRKRDTCRDVR